VIKQENKTLSTVYCEIDKASKDANGKVST
jgi:hypothetical protein